MPKVWLIEDADVRLYHDAMVGVATSMAQPWTARGKPRWGGKRIEQDDQLPTGKQIQQQLMTYYTPVAIQRVKERVYKARHRQKHKPEGVHLDQHAHRLLKRRAERLGLSFSDTLRYYLEEEPE